MRKLKLISVLIYLFCFGLSIYSVEVSNRPKIVVLNFKAMRVQKDLAEAVRENFTTSLVESNKFTVVERSQLDAIFKEMQLTSSDEFDDNQALEIGRLAKAKYAVVGSLSLIGTKYTINVRIIEIETGNITYAKKSGADTEEDLFYVVDDLVADFSEKDSNSTKSVKKKNTNDSKFRQANRNEMEIALKKYQNNLKSGISNLTSGLILSAIFVPLTYVGFYLYQVEEQKDYWYRDTDAMDRYLLLGILSTILSITGGILVLVGVINFISAGVYYAQYRAFADQSILPILDVVDDKIVIGLNFRLKT